MLRPPRLGKTKQPARIAPRIAMELFEGPIGRDVILAHEFQQLACFVEIERRKVKMNANGGREAAESAGGHGSDELCIAQNDDRGEPAPPARLVDDGLDFVPDDRRAAMGFIDDQAASACRRRRRRAESSAAGLGRPRGCPTGAAPSEWPINCRKSSAVIALVKSTWARQPRRMARSEQAGPPARSCRRLVLR